MTYAQQSIIGSGDYMPEDVEDVQEMFSCLSSEERKTLLSLLEKIHSDWESRFAGRHNHHKENDGQGNRFGKHRSGHSCYGQE